MSQLVEDFQFLLAPVLVRNLTDSVHNSHRSVPMVVSLALGVDLFHFPEGALLLTDPRPAGSHKRKVEPCPTSLSTQILPPNSSSNRRTMCSPHPTPPQRLASELSAWRNISNI